MMSNAYAQERNAIITTVKSLLNVAAAVLTGSAALRIAAFAAATDSDCGGRNTGHGVRGGRPVSAKFGTDAGGRR